MRAETLEWIELAEGDFQTATREAAVSEAPNFDAVCFHSQQCAEKYLKGFLTEQSIYFPKTHDLEFLVAKVTTVAPEGATLADAAKALADYSIDPRYPGPRADKPEAAEALTNCKKVRSHLRDLLGLSP
jgi:HEPN domain-containing protein